MCAGVLSTKVRCRASLSAPQSSHQHDHYEGVHVARCLRPVKNTPPSMRPHNLLDLLHLAEVGQFVPEVAGVFVHRLTLIVDLIGLLLHRLALDISDEFLPT